MPGGLGSIPVYKIRPDAELPRRTSDGAIGYDAFASRVLDRQTKDVLSELPVTIGPSEAVLIGIGVIIAIPLDPPFEIQVRPRSGLANKFRIELSNSPGTVDPDFRGEVGCLLVNRGDKPYTVNPNDRIAQLIFSRVELPEIRT
ncbi:MAG: dUTP diphosphatase, partial [Candidatus Berkelbacteria bacterium]|nr:dUTP diphosphatase [Candidatus Berkelbacteria bacterium]